MKRLVRHRILFVTFILSFLIFVNVSSIAAEYPGPVLVIGNGISGLKDGGYSEAEFNEPYSACVFKDTIFITDSGNHCIRTIDLKKKQVSVFTGGFLNEERCCDSRGYHDGHVLTARFDEPRGIAVDRDGVLYVADTGNHVIRKIKDNRVFTYAGTGKPGDISDKIGNSEFNRPSDVAILGEYIYVADSLNAAIKSIDKEGNVRTVLKGKELIEPTGLCVDQDSLYIVDSGAQKILKYKENKGAFILAGSMEPKDEQTGYVNWGYRDGDVYDALFNFPRAAEVYQTKLLVADTWNACIRVIAEDQVKTLISFKNRHRRPTKMLVLEDTIMIVDNEKNQLLFYGR